MQFLHIIGEVTILTAVRCTSVCIKSFSWTHRPAFCFCHFFNPRQSDAAPESKELLSWRSASGHASSSNSLDGRRQMIATITTPTAVSRPCLGYPTVFKHGKAMCVLPAFFLFFFFFSSPGLDMAKKAFDSQHLPTCPLSLWSWSKRYVFRLSPVVLSQPCLERTRTCRPVMTLPREKMMVEVGTRGKGLSRPE